MNDFLVHSADVTGPATHAVVIGVGAYPHLVGGAGALSRDNEGMRQLTSPPESARAVAQWLIAELHDPNKPVATVALLLSEAKPGPFRHPKTGRPLPVQQATLANTKQVLIEWKGRGDGDGNHRLLFYFCGHGIARGSEVSLLLDDFGASPANPLEGAIDFRKFHLGMDFCEAREQCYFVDACRGKSETALGADGYMGDPIVMPRGSGLRVPAPPPRESPIYYSTLAGQDAYGRRDAVTPFTNALLRGLNGAGSDDGEGDWRVDTTQLKRAIDFLMKRERGEDERPLQLPATNNLTTFFLHYLAGEPSVPVFVGCRPDLANEHAKFTCLAGNAVLDSRAPAEGEWAMELHPGDYEFAAGFATGPYRSATRRRSVRPVIRQISLDVG